MENLILPTPPRSPQPPKNQIGYSYEDDDEDENMLEDFINLLNEDNFSDLFDEQKSINNNTNINKRKRKQIDEQIFNDFEQHFGDVTNSILSNSTTTNTTDPSELIDHLLSFENNFDSTIETSSFDSPPPTNPPSPIKQEIEEDFLKDFDNFDSFEKLASKPLAKRLKLDSESSDYYFDDNSQSMLWNNPSISPLFNNFGEFFEDNNNQFLDSKEDEEIDLKPDLKLESINLGIKNDHSYAMSNVDVKLDEFNNEEDIEFGEIEVKHEIHHEEQVTESVFNFDKITKKTKILVPLKHLMETLQQKSYLVSPLGPGKKVIRLTGNDSVKGVLQSSALLTVSKPPSQHNVRKRPHNPLLNRYNTSPKIEEPQVTNSSQQNSNQNQTSQPTKKKTKAHNNMERMRRIDLRNSFDNLKKLVPILNKSPKCSKVEILRKAEEYIRGLRLMEKKLIKEEQQLKVKLQQLKLKIETN